MILPNYKVNFIEKRKGNVFITITFDKVVVSLSGSAKYKSLDLFYTIKKGVRRRNVNLLKYFRLINDYLVSNDCILTYDNVNINIFDTNIVKSLSIRGLKITSGDMEYVKDKFKNLRLLETTNCTIYKQANIGILSCYYTDYKSDIMSLDSFNGFSGRNLYFHRSNILNNNSHLLHLYSVTLTMNQINIDYEKFMLMLDAPNLRKLVIFNTKDLTDKDLLFISGLYNLERLEVDAILSNADQIKKLERLRYTSRIFVSGNSEIEQTKKKRKNFYDMLKEAGRNEKQLNDYLMFQYMMIYNEYLDLLNKLYVKRIDRIKWENKIHLNELNRIKKELFEISNMPYADKKNISREIKEYNLQDSLDDLWFDKVPTSEEEEHLVNSRPFNDGGIDYYVKRKKIILYK